MYTPFKVKDFDKNLPLIIWFQGGPGSSGWVGNFYELGPFILNPESKDKTQLLLNQFAWNNNAYLLFIDQPLGVGFSTFDNKSIVNSTYQAAEDFEQFMINFYKAYPSLQDNDLYFTGESYAGHYIPGFTYQILKNKNQNKIKISGIAIGDGLIDPINQQTYHEITNAAGIVSTANLQYLAKNDALAIQLIYQGKYAQASEVFDKKIEYIGNKSQASVYNFRDYGDSNEPVANFTRFITDETLRKTYNIPDGLKFQMSNEQMFGAFKADIAMSFKYGVEEALNQNLKVLIYQGQDDVIINTNGILQLQDTIKWKGMGPFRIQKKKFLYYDKKIKGTFKNYGKFTSAIIFNSGHLVPGDQPEISLVMIEKFIKNDWATL